MIKVNDMNFVRMIDKKDIKKEIKRLGKEINKEFKNDSVEVIIVLKGAFIFAADLIRQFRFDHNVHFVQFSSYAGTQSTGNIFEKLSLSADVKGKRVLVIEDIVDTGNTLEFFIKKLNEKGPKSIDIATLLFKKEAFKKEYTIRFRAFDIENKFVIGYGLDLNEKHRNLKHIYQLKGED